MAKDNLSKKKLDSLIDQVSLALSETLAKAELDDAQPLLKVAPGQEAPAEKIPPGSSSDETSADESSADTSSSDSPAPPASSSPEASTPAPDASASPDGQPAPDAGTPDGAAPAEDTGSTVEQLQAEYAALPIDQQKMHLLALKAALMHTLASQGGEGDAGASASDVVAPDASAAAPAPATPAPSVSPAPDQSATTPMAKTEIVIGLKQLEELETLKKSLKEKDEIISKFGEIAVGLKGLLDRNNGRRLSVAAISAIPKDTVALAKTEEVVDISSLTPEQITKKLCQVASKSDLKKSDRDLINTYTAGRIKNISTIAHLLKE